MEIALDGVHHLIEGLCFPSEVKDLACAIITTQGDFCLFISEYYNRNAYVIDDVLDFREALLKDRDMTENEFVDACYSSYSLHALQELFTNTFLQSFSFNEIMIVMRKVMDGDITFFEIFTKFKQNTNQNIMRILMSN